MSDEEPTLGDRRPSIPSADTDRSPPITPARAHLDPRRIPVDPTPLDPMPHGASAMAVDALHPADLLADDTSRETPMEPAITRPQILAVPTDTGPVATSPALPPMPDPPSDEPSTDHALDAIPHTPSAVAAALRGGAALRPVTSRALPAQSPAPPEELPPTLRATPALEATAPIALPSGPPLRARARLTALHLVGLALTIVAIAVVAVAKLSQG